MSTHNKVFYEEISKIIPLLSPNTHLISSSVSRFYNFFSVSVSNCVYLNPVIISRDSDGSNPCIPRESKPRIFDFYN